MSKTVWAGVALMLLATPAMAQPVLLSSESARFQAQDLFGLSVASDPQISPDGTRIAYVRQTADIMTDRMRPTIWLIDVRTGQQTPLAVSTGSHSQPRWSPDGTRIAYTSTAEGGGAQLFVHWVGSGQSARVTSLPSTPSGMSWSPDGTKIAYSMFVAGPAPKIGTALSKPEGAQWAAPLEVIDTVTYRSDGQGYLKSGYRQVFVAPADGGGARQLTQGNFNHGGKLSWAPDSSTLYISANRHADWQRETANSEVFALDVRSGELTALTDRMGPDQSPIVSPDGRQIAYVGYDDKRMGYHNARLYVMNRDGSNRRELTTSLDRSVQSPAWSKDGRSILFTYDNHARPLLAASLWMATSPPWSKALAATILAAPIPVAASLWPMTAPSPLRAATPCARPISTSCAMVAKPSLPA